MDGLCRTEALGPKVFDGMPQHLECTYLGLWLAARCRLGFLDTPTLVWSKNTPGSASKSREYVLGQAVTHRRLLALDLPPDVRADCERRISSAYHNTSISGLDNGAYRDTWMWHFRCLVERRGWRYTGFTAHLLWALTDSRDHPAPADRLDRGARALARRRAS